MDSWSPPPLPVEVSSRSRRYADFDSGDEEEVYEDGLFYDDDGQSLSALSSEAGGRGGLLSREAQDTVSDALQLIYEQKKKTIESIKSKRAAADAGPALTAPVLGSRLMIATR